MTEFAVDTEHPIVIPFRNIHLDGLLHIPAEPTGMIIFAHGSGSSRFSPRNQATARVLQHSKFATLLFDLFTPEEDEIDSQTMAYRFNIKFLSERLLAATDWVQQNLFLKKLPIGYFGASTGGGAALSAAAEAASVKAVVSRGGRPDLAGEALPKVKAATLLIVGGNDDVVIELNKQAFEKLNCVKELVIVPGATHLFEEPGKLDEVARLANEWFRKYLTS